eukprot:CAMPEP_0119371332 /NCGR_PEP_ID=MMETSP1334-20130426/17523_1 /TAXON_ID=127549 /ORGANISM="Calcidiscus leptoporus, Strain RCC1130" /LENGTH=40 /DNA_ID= /DNA_START= /DNA_END= /DNA_ORIENTATION=
MTAESSRRSPDRDLVEISKSAGDDLAGDLPSQREIQGGCA